MHKSEPELCTDEGQDVIFYMYSLPLKKKSLSKDI